MTTAVKANPRALSRHAVDFIDETEINGLLDSGAGNDPQRLREIIAKSLEKKPLSLEETAYLSTRMIRNSWKRSSRLRDS